MKTRYYPYRVTLESDASLTEFGGNPNTIRSLSYVPGSAMRGVAARKLESGGQQAAFNTLVLNGTVCYLNAYPLFEGCRALPTPVSYRKYKRDRIQPGADLTLLDLSACDCDADLNDELESLAEPFITYTADKKTLLALESSGKVHHQRDRRKGRAWTDFRGGAHGALFSMEALSAGQRFEGLLAIRGEDKQACDNLFNALQSCFENTILVGRSRRAGYGGSGRLEWGKPRGRELTGGNLMEADIPAGDRFGVLLTSAYIGRNPLTGHCAPAHFIDELANKLGGGIACVKECRAYVHAGGFNRKWGLEMPQVVALAAGSMFLCTATVPLSLETLLKIEGEGLGERKSEGFGRIAFVKAPQRELVAYGLSDDPPAQRPQNPPPPPIIEAEKRLLQKVLGQGVAEYAARLAGDAVNIPSNSLLGRLRGVLRAGDSRGLETLREWLGDGENALRRTAMDQLEKCRIGGRGTKCRLRAFIVNCVEKKNRWPEEISQSLNLHVIAQRHCLTTEERALALLDGLRQETIIQMLDALLAALAVAKRREGERS